MAGRHGKYLYRRAGSPNWYLRLVYPPELHKLRGKRVEESLGTTDWDEALHDALPRIQQHKADLLMVRSMMRHQTMATEFVHQPGREYHQPDGSKIVATAKDLIHIGADGAFIKVEPNRPRERTIWQTTPAEAQALGLPVEKMSFAKPKPQSKGPEPDPDHAILEDFLALEKRNRFYDAEARRVWAEFKEFVGGKALKDCTRTDGRAFAEHLRKMKGLKTATIVKYVNYLAAPINHANEIGDLKGNPFFKVITRVDDAEERIDFSDDDMRLMREEMLPKLGRDERLLWLVLASTGMRHSEAFSIREEFVEEGIRYVKVGGKTVSSVRQVPLPDCLIPHLPARITGPLFEDLSLKNVGKNLLRAVRRVGITDSRKVVYSLRHRAHTRLRNAECDGDVQRAIVGHETGESHVKYGQFPIRVLRRWINEIKF
jgi:integrase